MENEGLATTQISLVREHTVKIAPPRALWVPFPFGRPLGVPGDAAFQRRVLDAVLGLLERDRGPVLEDYGEEAPGPIDETGWACPVSFPAPPTTSGDALLDAVLVEIQRLMPWHVRATEARGYSTVGILGVPIEAVVRYAAGHLSEAPPPSPKPGIGRIESLVFATEDIKAFYLESAAAQPGTPTSADLLRWFHGETAAGRLYARLLERGLIYGAS